MVCLCFLLACLYFVNKTTENPKHTHDSLAYVNRLLGFSYQREPINPQDDSRNIKLFPLYSFFSSTSVMRYESALFGSQRHFRMCPYVFTAIRSMHFEIVSVHWSHGKSRIVKTTPHFRFDNVAVKQNGVEVWMDLLTLRLVRCHCHPYQMNWYFVRLEPNFSPMRTQIRVRCVPAMVSVFQIQAFQPWNLLMIQMKHYFIAIAVKREEKMKLN